MAHIQYVDSLICEYMLFRGFSGSLRTFETELKTEKDKGFRVDKIIDQITHAINVHDLTGLRDIWSHLDGHLFSKLEHSFMAGKLLLVIVGVFVCVFKLYNNFSREETGVRNSETVSSDRIWGFEDRQDHGILYKTCARVAFAV